MRSSLGPHRRELALDIDWPGFIEREVLRLGDFDFESSFVGDDELHVRIVGSVTDDDVHAIVHRMEHGAESRAARRVWDLRSAELLDPEPIRYTLSAHASADARPRAEAFVSEDPLFEDICRQLAVLRPQDRFGVFPDVPSAERWLRQA